MQNDKTTLKDLSFFTADGSGGVFALIDRTTTQVGRDRLRMHLQRPADNYDRLIEVQQTVKYWVDNDNLWPTGILNGTIVMLEKFFDSADMATAPPSGVMLLLNNFFQKVLNKRDYFFTQFSLSHLSDFLKGCTALAAIATTPGLPTLLHRELLAIKDELNHRLTADIMAVNKQTKFPVLAQLGYQARREMKGTIERLIASYARLDAWRAMAKATVEHGWVFPDLQPASPVCLDTRGLKHPLLQKPVAYDLKLNYNQNFLVLTGANMSGKTTFMRALGVGALLAHLGMGVPAAYMRISFLYGVITNMQVEDNIHRGESYFFAEVQRMKQTAEKLLQPQPQLALMDELFKGTNVHDAYECTKAVMDGLMNHPNHLMILSTHLYEVAQQFSTTADVQLAYFVTATDASGAYEFTYELRQGISNDRIGYRILQKEGVIDLLNRKT
jgi:DNA mismatch repair ATPase MutS